MGIGYYERLTNVGTVGYKRGSDLISTDTPPSGPHGHGTDCSGGWCSESKKVVDEGY